MSCTDRETVTWGVSTSRYKYLRAYPVNMIDLLIAGVVGILATLGGLFIKDLKVIAILHSSHRF